MFYAYIRIQEYKQEQFVTQTQSTIVTQLQSLSRLTTAQMTLSKIIESKKDFSDLIPGFGLDDDIRKALFDDALLMTIEGKVDAGIDLSKVTTGSIVVRYEGSKNIVSLYLPKAEIFDAYLTDKTKPFERKLGILSKGNQDLETKIRNEAILAIKNDALEQKILETAENNARIALQDFVSKL